MSFITNLENSLPGALKQLNLTHVHFFLYVALGANLGMAAVFYLNEVFIDWSDSGSIAILAVIVFFYNLFTWIYVKRIALPAR
jgi:hypothetical protein